MSDRPADPPAIDCAPLAPFDDENLDAVRAAFRDATPVALGQAWLTTTEPEFAGAIVRTGWRDDSLFVLAELTDGDIFTRATGHNQRFWELGDTFEMFLQAAGE